MTLKALTLQRLMKHLGHFTGKQILKTNILIYHTTYLIYLITISFSRTSTYWKEAAIQYWNNLPVSPSITSNDISLIDTTDITPNDNSVDDISKKVTLSLLLDYLYIFCEMMIPSFYML
jgi:hypothetical protein